MEKLESKKPLPTFPQPRLLRHTLSHGIRIQGARPDLHHRQPFPNPLNLPSDIEGVVSLMHAASPMSVRNPFPADLASDSLRPRASVGFLAFPAFLWDVWENRGEGLHPRLHYLSRQLFTRFPGPNRPSYLGLVC